MSDRTFGPLDFGLGLSFICSSNNSAVAHFQNVEAPQHFSKREFFFRFTRYPVARSDLFRPGDSATSYDRRCIPAITASTGSASLRLRIETLQKKVRVKHDPENDQRDRNADKFPLPPNSAIRSAPGRPSLRAFVLPRSRFGENSRT